MVKIFCRTKTPNDDVKEMEDIYLMTSKLFCVFLDSLFYFIRWTYFTGEDFFLSLCLFYFLWYHCVTLRILLIQTESLGVEFPYHWSNITSVPMMNVYVGLPRELPWFLLSWLRSFTVGVRWSMYQPSSMWRWIYWKILSKRLQTSTTK